MYFVVVKEISTGTIVDKAELPGMKALSGSIAQLAYQLKEQFKTRYSPETYTVTFEEAENWEELLSKNISNKDSTFRMIGSRTYQLVVNIAAMIGGTFLISFLLVVRLIYSPFLFIVCIFILFLYLTIDYSIWLNKGIHMIEMDISSFTVYYGKEMIPARIDKRQITGINVFKKLNRRIVNIMLGGYADNTIPGVTLFSGPRIRITDEAFNESEFGIFVKLLYDMRPDIN